MASGQPKQNVLFILSDEHNANVAGFAGHPLVQTPNLDRLAARGTRFDNAYCNSPICVPSRASLATGRHVHEIRFWDNAAPYTGTPKAWHHLVRDSGADMVSIGKLHFRGGDDYGFTEELIPLHVVGGKGDLKGLFRQDLPKKIGTEDMALEAGRGESTYLRYDENIAATACRWLEERSKRTDDRPFALFVSFVMPHFPLIAPASTYDLYEKYDLATLAEGIFATPTAHPTIARLREHFDYDKYFDDDRRAKALRAYYGMVTRLDQLVGDVLDALTEGGQASNTTVIYTSDHGENLGNRGLWGKSVMYDDAAAVPMIVAGHNVPSGAVCHTPASLIDIAPTVADVMGVDASGEHYPGTSLRALAQAADDMSRTVLSQYHASGSDTGQFMLRRGRWKYVHYAGAPPQLFDLKADPGELLDLAADPAYAGELAEMEVALRTICTPENVNTQAFADQAAVVAHNGGRAAIEGTVDIPFTPAPV